MPETKNKISKQPTISIIIPCYKEEAVLPRLFKRLNTASLSWNCSLEVICVDDGSNDNTWGILTKFHTEDKQWKAIRLSRNFGHQSAISAGLYHATGDVVVILDADLQDPPEIIMKFIEKWKEGFDIVYGRRTKRKGSMFKRFSYWLFYRIMAKITPFEIPLDTGDFCLMSKQVVDVINKMPERIRFVRGLRAYAGFKQAEITYKRGKREAGTAQYTMRKLLKLALDGLYSFSAFPLKLASHFGFIISFIALVGIVFTFLQRIFSTFFLSIGFGPVPGYATTVILILFLGGVQLLFLGILGEYLYRIFEEVKQRPPWIIQDSTGIDIKNLHK